MSEEVKEIDGEIYRGYSDGRSCLSDRSIKYWQGEISGNIICNCGCALVYLTCPRGEYSCLASCSECESTWEFYSG